MALLNTTGLEQDQDENQPSKPATIQPVQPIAPVQPRQPVRKATGFTNLQKVMQANRGSQIGQTMAGGITGQAQRVQQGIQGAQQRFSEQAEKARLDTPEAAAKRQQVLGRFDESQYNVDESQFKMGDQLQQGYQQGKAGLQGQINQRSTESRAATARLQAMYDTDAAKMKTARDQKGYQASLSNLQKLMAIENQRSGGDIKDLKSKLDTYEAQYGVMTEAEKAKWVQAEKDKMVAANLPSEQEMQEFERYQSGAYTGPKELEDAGTLFGKAAQAEAIARQARSTGGREELLKRFVGGNNYTEGMRGLDLSLLSQEKDTGLSQASRAASGLSRNVEEANLVAASKAADFTSKAKQFGTETQGLIGEARSGISGRIDQQIKDTEAKEAARVAQYGKLEGILKGTDPAAKSLDPMVRTALALQTAVDSGYMDPNEVASLTAKGGLIERSKALGLDINTLLAERMKNIGQVGLDRRGAATADQEARISALDRLSGKVGMDVEFGQGTEQYKAGQTKFDLDNLVRKIAEEEKLKMANPAYAAKMKQQNITPLEQMLGGAMYGLTGADDKTALATTLAPAAVGAGLGAYGASAAGTGMAAGAGAGAGTMATSSAAGPIALAVMLGMDLLNKGDATAKTSEGAHIAAHGAGRATNEATDSVFNALLKANMGGLSLGGTPAGEQLTKLNQFRSEQFGSMNDEYLKHGMTYAQGLRDMTQTGRLDQALAKLSGHDTMKRVGSNVAREAGQAYKNVEKAVGTAFGGGKTGNWAGSKYKVFDTDTGKAVKVGSLANASSDKLYAQMNDIAGSIEGKGGKGERAGLKKFNELMNYYNAALKREGKA